VKAPTAVAKDALAKEAVHAHARPLVRPQPVFVPTMAVQRKCACGGGCPRCEQEAARKERIQTKLTIGPVGDRYEREADRVSAEIIGMPEPAIQRQELPPEEEEWVQMKPFSAGISPLVQSQTQTDSAESASGLTPEDARAIEDRRGGSPLPESVRRYMEPRFAADFNGVRVHSGPDSAHLNHSLHARAFTYGQDIWLGAGESASDLPLMAHELTHVLQQSRVPPKLRVGNPNESLEAEGDRDSEKVVSDEPTRSTHRAPPRAVYCQSQEPAVAAGAIPDYDAFSEPSGKIKEGEALIALVKNWEQLDRVYSDAAAGDARAKRFIRELEEYFAAIGEQIAIETARPACLIPAYKELQEAFSEACTPNWNYISFLRADKTGGARLRRAIGDAYEKKARALAIRIEIIGHGLNLLVAGSVIKSATAKGATAVETPAIKGGTIESGTGTAIAGESSALKAAKAEGVLVEETTATKGAKVETPKVVAVSSALSKALAELRAQHPPVDALSDAAFSRVMSKGRAGINAEAQVQAMKGQLLEEIGEVNIGKMMATEAGKKALGMEGAKGTPELIPGHSIKLRGEQFTDGVIGAKDAATKTIEANAIVEAKAGVPSSAGLAKSSGIWNEASAEVALGAIETDLVGSAAMRQQFCKIHKSKLKTFHGGKFNSPEKLKDMHVSDLRNLLNTVEKVKATAKKLGITQVEKGGQFSKDIERVVEEGGTTVQLTNPITGAVEDWRLNASPTRTKMVAVLPGDVAAKKGAALKSAVEAAKPFKVEVLPVAPTEPQLKAAAEALKKLIDQGL
jgi:hypothetical protein